MGTDPRAALDVLRAAADDGRLEQLCQRHGVRVLTVFGSAVRPDAVPREPTAYATAQVAAMGERTDTDWLRALDLEAMRR